VQHDRRKIRELRGSWSAGARGLKSALAMSMSSQQTSESMAEASGASADGFLDGGLFVAGVAIGIAPAAAAAGIMLGSRLIAFGGTGALLLLGFAIAAVASDL
jgi:hypothetical protein